MLAKVTKIVRETHDTVCIRLDANLDFVPGQFVMIEPNIPGVTKSTKRSYSIASSPTKDYLELCIKEAPDGFVSKWANETLKVGDKIEMSEPLGNFQLDDSLKKVVLIGAGSGITPFHSMMQYIADKKLKTQVTLFYSSKTPEDIIYKKELEKFDKLKNMKVINTITRPETSKTKWIGATGRISLDFITEYCDMKEVFFLCGPPAFVRSMEDLLKQAKVPAERIKKEVYG